MQPFLAALLLVLVACLSGARADSITVINPDSFYPEGPLWHDGKLYYVEYSAHTVMSWDGKENEQLWKQEGCGPAALIDAPDGNLLVSCYDADTLVRITLGGRTIETIAHDSDGNSFKGPNDFVRDESGGIYFSASGVFDEAAPIEGRIYYIAPGGEIRLVADIIHYVNGLALTEDGKALLASEHLAARVLRFNIGENRSLYGRTVFKRLRDLVPDMKNADVYTGPDGLKIDSAGNVYICQYGGGRILVVDRGGKLSSTIHVPARYVTNVNFGATENVLFITAATDAWNAPYPGKVFRVELP